MLLIFAVAMHKAIGTLMWSDNDPDWENCNHS